MTNAMVQRIQWYAKVADKFQRIYGKSLKNYFHNLTGFDVCKFNDDLKVPDNVSMEAFIVKKYGQEAVDIIKPLF